MNLNSPTIRRFHVVLTPLVYVAILACGCSSNEPVSSGTSDPTDTSSATAPQFPRYVVSWHESSGVEHEESGNAVTPEILARQYEKLNWTDPSQSPSLAVARQADEMLAVKSVDSDNEGSHDLVAVWIRPGPVLGSTTTSIRSESKPLDGDAHALEILNAFAAQAEDFESLVQWELKNSEPDDSGVQR